MNSPPLRGGTIHRAYRVRLFNAVKLSILTWDSIEKEQLLGSRKKMDTYNLTFTKYSKKTFAGQAGRIHQ